MVRKAVNYSAKLARDKSRTESGAFLFSLHCDGVISEVLKKSCNGVILVPMVALKSIVELSEQVKTVDWRVSIGKTEDKTPVACVQCTDCWIAFYRTMTKGGKEDPQELYKVLDKEGKYWDRLTRDADKDN